MTNTHTWTVSTPRQRVDGRTGTAWEGWEAGYLAAEQIARDGDNGAVRIVVDGT